MLGCWPHTVCAGLMCSSDVCVWGGCAGMCVCVFLDLSEQQSELSPEIHPCDRDHQHQQQIFSLDRVLSRSSARR